MRMPLAQIELLAIDQPVVVYPKTDKVQMDGGKTRSFSRPSRDELSEANSWWLSELKKHKNKQ